MTNCGWIIDDAARLRTLREFDILDTPAEAAYDAIVAQAADLCATPVALVTLLADDRQWFKAKLGTDVPGTPIAMAICTHTLVAGGPLVIANLAADPRTADNPLVTGEPHVRFYAGAPLVAGGQALGTLCVLDTAPRPEGLTEAQAAGLAALAQDVVALIERGSAGKAGGGSVGVAESVAALRSA